ncbi:hypothetical protein ENUP19_0055G0081 [Entamoeba nuttalli]
MSKFINLISSRCSNTITKPIIQEFDYVYISISICDVFNINDIESFLKICIPTKMLCIFIEGIVPLALLRSRKHKILHSIDFDNLIKNFIQKHPSVEVILSDKLVSGDANQKALDFVRKQLECMNCPLDNTHCFISNSMPFQFLSLHLPKSVIYIPSVGIMFDLIPTALTLLESYNIELINHNLTQLVDDLVVLSLITENDVIPQEGEISLDGLLREYQREIKTQAISSNGTISKQFIGKILLSTFQHQIEDIKKKEVERGRRLIGNVEHEIDQLNYQNDQVAKKLRKDLITIRGRSKNAHTAQYVKCLNTIASQKDVEYVCQMYWKGIEWCCISTFRGIPDWDWFYQFNAPPEITDLIQPCSSNSFSLGRPIHPLIYQILISSCKSKLPNGLEWLNTSQSEFYEYFRNPQQMDILQIIKIITESKLFQDLNSIHWGWHELWSTKQYVKGTLIPNECDTSQPSQIDIIVKGSFLSYKNKNIVEGNIIQCFNKKHQEDKELPFKYGFIEPWYSKNFIFESCSIEAPQRILQFDYNERKRKHEEIKEPIIPPFTY